MKDRINVLLDFDGTVSRHDTTDEILAAFADPQWHEIEHEWVTGRIGSRTCMSRQVALMRASPEALDRLVDGIEVDEHLPQLVDVCRDRGVSLTIVSDGLDRVIARVLRRFDLCVPVIANRLVCLPDGRWSLDFPNAAPYCEAGTCKCLSASSGGGPTILVGDGRSDFCVAEAASVVFAKAKLAEHCRLNGIPFLPLPNLGAVACWLAEAALPLSLQGTL
ncbi:HAD-IB family phosphatase [Ancylobacter sp.]|uniref:HAD-IB family phosphatase n=1 Tax=Ancylobacter sp. TaxID=1872567 RepID=UPI003C7D85C1